MTFSSATTAKLVFSAFVTLSILGQTAQNLASPLWYASLPESSCADAFVQFLIMILWYPVLFFLTSVAVRVYNGQTWWGFLTLYDRRKHWVIFMTGLVDALNGALVIPSSPSMRTPAIVAALIGSTTLLPMIIVKHFYFRVSDKKPYKTGHFLLVLFLYLATAYTIVYGPATDKQNKGNNKVYWWVIFFIGSVLGNAYNMMQEHSFHSWGKHSTFPEFVQYLFWQTFYLMLWGYALIWMDVIPGFGDAAKSGLECSLHDTFLNSFRGDALLFNVIFNVGYYVTYIAACFVNHSDALIGTISSAAVTALVTAIAYNNETLTPDKSVIQIGLVPLTIMLAAVNIYLYERWSVTNNVYSHPKVDPDESTHLLGVQAQSERTELSVVDP